jgi:hypothetical protein
MTMGTTTQVLAAAAMMTIPALAGVTTTIPGRAAGMTTTPAGAAAMTMIDRLACPAR